MNRTLKRPMFRMGGSTGSGITSGLDTTKPKRGLVNEPGKYSQPEDPQDRAFRPDIKQALSTAEIANDPNVRSSLFSAPGGFSPGSPGGFLTSFGLDLLSRPPTGKGFRGLLSTAATSAKEPLKTFQAANLARSGERSKFARDLFEGDLQSQYSLEEERVDNLGEGKDGRMSPERERDIIINAQNDIFAQLDIINNVESTPEEIDAAQRQIKTSESVLTKELGVPPEYLAIISDPTNFNYAMDDYVKTENKERIEAYQKDNPNATPEDIQANVPLIESNTAEARALTFQKLKEEYGFRSYKADGGRMGLRFGGQPMMEEVAEAPQQAEDLSYNELRTRLPQEISNDIVQLLANSKQALMDFANIQTAEDIASFNQQYDVNLTLPQGA